MTGAAVGAGVALGGGFAAGTYARILGFWFAIPVVEGVLAYGLAWLLLDDRVSDTLSIPLLAGGVGYALANIRLSFLPAPRSDQGSIAGVVTRQFGLTATGLGDAAIAVVAGLIGVLTIGVVYWNVRLTVSSSTAGSAVSNCSSISS